MKKIRVFEAFAGYGSQAMALQRLKEQYPEFDYEVVGISEIDKYAIRAYMAVHGETPNYGDICKIDPDALPDFDLFTYSFPCTDISTEGLQKGLSEGSGTRSGLLWECRKIITAKRPQYLLMENVKALLQKKFIGQYQKWGAELDGLGYATFTKVLNAKDYGVPQNRERVFAVSILLGDDGARPTYNFPKPFQLLSRLKDVLETNVPTNYYLSAERIKNIKLYDGKN